MGLDYNYTDLDHAAATLGIQEADILHQRRSMPSTILSTATGYIVKTSEIRRWMETPPAWIIKAREKHAAARAAKTQGILNLWPRD